MRKVKGSFDPITIAIIAICFVIGGFFAIKSKTIDHPIEQAAEKVLKAEGIDIDFSEEKKKKRDAESRS